MQPSITTPQQIYMLNKPIIVHETLWTEVILINNHEGRKSWDGSSSGRCKLQKGMVDSILLWCTWDMNLCSGAASPTYPLTKPQSMIYKDAPPPSPPSRGLSALPWRPNSMAASKSWRRWRHSSPKRPWLPQEKMCGLSALPWWPNPTAASRSWRRWRRSSPERSWSCSLWTPRRRRHTALVTCW